MTIRELTEDDVLAVSDGCGDPGWLRDRRLEAFKAFRDLDWPTNRDEEWRYTNPRRFDLDREIGLEAGDVSPTTSGIVAAVRDSIAGSARIVDGGCVEASVEAEAAERGVVVADLVAAAREHPDVVRAHLGTVVGDASKFDALSLAAFTCGALVYVPPEVQLDDPVVVTVQASSEGAFLPRVLIVLGPLAKATVYVDHAGSADSTIVEAVEVVAGDGAKARVVTAQDWGAGVSHIASHRGTVGTDADYRHLEVTLGGESVYIRPDVGLDGAGGHGELLGVYFGSADQHFEHRCLIHHNASHTVSESVYKGALQGSSRAAWFGNIRIEPHAKATSSDETNRNLILTDGARADSIPWLEILTSDVVRCGHHSSVGQVDAEQLFYLQSRGISREEAARLLVFGFFTEVLERIDLPGVTDTVLREIADEIRRAPTVSMDQRRR